MFSSPKNGALYCITIVKLYIWKNTHIPWADIPPPLINNRYMEHHYSD